MKAIILEKKRTVMENPDSHFNYFAWPTVTRLTDGRLALGASGWRLDHVCPFGKAALSFSDDEGETWSLPAVAQDTPLDDRDVGLCPFGEGGLVLTSFNNTREIQRNRHPDRAFNLAYLATVTDEEEERFLGYTFRVSFDNGASFGPIHRSPVTSPHGPCVLKDGTILWVGRPFHDEEAGDPIQAYEITPEGEAIFRGELPRASEDLIDCEPHAIELPDGRIICQIREQTAKRKPGDSVLTIFQSESSDGGRTWTQPRRILGDIDGVPPHLLLLSDGTLISAYGRRQPPRGIRVMVSRDLGRTWETNLVLTDDGVSWDLGYPATVELTDGTLLTVFYEHETLEGPAVIRQIKWKLER